MLRYAVKYFSNICNQRQDEFTKTNLLLFIHVRMPTVTIYQFIDNYFVIVDYMVTKVFCFAINSLFYAFSCISRKKSFWLIVIDTVSKNVLSASNLGTALVSLQILILTFWTRSFIISIIFCSSLNVFTTYVYLNFEKYYYFTKFK